jgi:uncharacterized protein YkwD
MGRIISLAAAVLLLGLGLVATPARALDPSSGVNAGTSPSDWFDKQQAANPNWEVTNKISPAMSQILGDVLIDFGSYKPVGNVCKAAAAGQAWQALADAANSGPLEGFLDAIKGALSGIKDIATFGADPSEAADMLEAHALVKKAFDDAKGKAEDDAKDYLKGKLRDIWKGKKVEVLQRTGKHGACESVLVATWDEGAGTYEIVIYGSCNCSAVGGWAVGSAGTSLRTYAVTLTGTVTAAISQGRGVYIIGAPKVTVFANCGCGGKDSRTAGGPGPITDGPVGPPPPPSTYEGWGKVTTACKDCQPIVDQIRAAQDARDALTRPIMQADDETRNAARLLQAASPAQKPAAQAEYDAAKAVSDDLTMRDAGLILLEQKLWEKLKQCEAKCGHASSGVCPRPGGEYALAPKSEAAGTNGGLAAAVLTQINAARADPQGYAQGLAKFETYYHGKEVDAPGRPRAMTTEGTPAVDNAIADLSARMPVASLQPSEALTASATRLVVDLGPKGKLGHTGSDGSTMRDRIQGAGVYAAAMEEDVSLAQSTAVDVVRQLIIDDGVPTRGHRSVVFDPGLTIAGVSCGPHATYGTMCVIDFAGSLKCPPGAENNATAGEL